ncbi:unnamed protein product, partial [Ectocarpus sp. 6 AP-2014]
MLFLVIVMVSRRPRGPIHALPGDDDDRVGTSTVSCSCSPWWSRSVHNLRDTRLSRDDVVIVAACGEAYARIGEE